MQVNSSVRFNGWFTRKDDAKKDEKPVERDPSKRPPPSEWHKYTDAELAKWGIKRGDSSNSH